jgi:SulP family sulfate permease
VAPGGLAPDPPVSWTNDDCRPCAARYLPVLDWGRRYNRDALSNDLIAAVIVTIMLIPQSLAYALLAGLPPEAGHLRLDRADHPLCDLRHQPRAGRRAGGGGLADDGRRVGQVAEQGTPGYAVAALTLAFLSGGFLVLLGVLSRWAFSPISSATR